MGYGSLSCGTRLIDGNTAKIWGHEMDIDWIVVSVLAFGVCAGFVAGWIFGEIRADAYRREALKWFEMHSGLPRLDDVESVMSANSKWLDRQASKSNPTKSFMERVAQEELEHEWRGAAKTFGEFSAKAHEQKLCANS